MFSLKIYHYYPEALLKQAMIKIRTDQMVTVRKNHLSSLKKGGNYVPMSSSQFKLSANYEYKLQTKWHSSVFTSTYDVFTKLLRHYTEQSNVAERENVSNGIEIRPVSSGIVMIMHDLLACNEIDFDIELPEQIIMLDSRYQDKDKDETYFRVAQRYQDILTRLYRFKFENVNAQNARLLELDEAKTNETSKELATRKRPADRSVDLETPATKISCKIEECDQSEQTENSPKNQPNVAATEEKLIELSVRLVGVTPMDHSGAQVSIEKDRTERSSKKRFIDVEENSVDSENPLSKRPRLYSEDSMDLPDVNELEESTLYEDLRNIEKMKVTSKFFQIRELTKEQAMETGMLRTFLPNS